MKARAWLAGIAMIGAAAAYAPVWVANAQDAGGEVAEEKKSEYGSAKEIMESMGELVAKFKDQNNPTDEEIHEYFSIMWPRMADYIEANPDAKDHAVIYMFTAQRGAWGYGHEGYVRIANAYLAANPDAKDKARWEKYRLLARLGVEGETEAAQKDLQALEAEAKKDASKLLTYNDIVAGWYEKAKRDDDLKAFNNGWKSLADYLENNPEAKDHDVIYGWASPRSALGYGNPDYVRVARAYLKAKADAKDRQAWEDNLLYARLGIEADSKAAQQELAKREEAHKADAARLLEDYTLRLRWYAKAEMKDEIARLVKTIDSAEVFAKSTDEWVQRRVHRVVFANNSAEIKVGEAFPDWAAVWPVKDIDGKTISVADYKGKIVLLDFWAVWCGPCMREMPNVIKLYEETHEKGFEVIGISLDQEEGNFDLNALRETIEGKRKVGKMPWRQIYDGGYWNSGIPKYYGTRSIPRTVLIDQNGVVVAEGLRGKELDAKVKELLAKLETADESN